MTKWEDQNPVGGTPWDSAKADKLIGGLVLVGLTHLDPSGEVTKQEQFFGHVALADPKAGIRLKLGGSRDGERFVLPPDLACITPASGGTYSLKSTGEKIVDPDYLATYTIKARAQG